MYSSFSTPMSSSSSPSPLIIPFKFRRKSSSASTSASMDHDIYSLNDATSSSSPLLSSLPLLTPLDLTRPYQYTKWRANDYSDDIDGIHDSHDSLEDAHDPWSRHTQSDHPLPYAHHPLPSLMTKFAPHSPRRGTPFSCSQSSFSDATQTAYLYPQGDSAIADDYEEYDLESMNIHIRETYFATSAERGRWLSSPIPSRVRSQATRAHSSPVKNALPLKQYSRSCSVDNRSLTSPEGECDHDAPSSPLPPSSPLTSPLSTVPLLADEHEDNLDLTVDPFSNSDGYHSLAGTPELSISSTTCTSPAQPVCSPIPQTPTILFVPPADHSCHSLASTVSRHTSPAHGPLPEPIDSHSPEPGDTLSPLSQFELDLPEAEPAKLPLSDRKNQVYPGQSVSLSVTATDITRRQDGPSSVQYLSMNHICETLDDPLCTIGGSTSNKRGEGRCVSTIEKPAAKRRSRAVIRSGSLSPDAMKRRGVESQASSHSEPPNKKSKLSHRRDDCERRRTNSLARRGGIPRVERHWRSPSQRSTEGRDTETTHIRDKTPKHDDRTHFQRRTPVPVDTADTEFYTSLTGMLIEALATSRATSMDSSTLYLILSQAHPDLVTKRSKGDLVMEIAEVLEAGRARCGMFEKVDSSGEKSRHKAPESRWFYIPERDEDPERAALISAIMPRQKRNETKKYKQYYYQPLDKISRWDPEDAL